MLMLSLVVTACDRSHMGAVPSGRMTPEEEGVTEYLKPRMAFIVSRQQDMANALENYRRQTQAGNAEQAGAASRAYFAALDKLGQYLIGLRPPDGPALLVPETMRPLLQELIAFESLKRSVGSLPLTDDQRGRIAAAANRVAAADLQLARLWNSRPFDFSSMPFSSNVTLELAGLPLKLDITNGEAKLKYSNSFGPLKTTFQGGFTSHSGIKTLIIQNRQHRRFFAIGGRPIDVYVPASRVRTAGSTMTIMALDVATD